MSDEVSSMVEEVMDMFGSSTETSNVEGNVENTDTETGEGEEVEDVEVGTETEQETAGEDEDVESKTGESTEDKTEVEESETEMSAEDIRKQLNEVAAEMLKNQTTQVEEVGEDEEKTKQEIIEQFVSEENFEEITSSPEALNKVLSNVYNKAVENALTRILPSVNQIVAQQMHVRNLVDNFYKENADLAPYKEFVGFLANQILSKNPDWAYEKVFEEVEKLARAKLKLPKGGGDVETETKVAKRKPAKFKAPKANRPEADKLTDLEREILDVIS